MAYISKTFALSLLNYAQIEREMLAAVVGRYLEIFHLGEGESTVLLKTNWEMSLTYSPEANLWSISESSLRIER